MSVGFVVLSHRDPRQVVRLVATIEALLPSATVVVHHDRSGEPLGAAGEWLGDRLVPDPVAVEWAAWSAVAATAASLRHLAARSASWEWAVTLSGQDYPVRPLADLAAMLAASEADAYLDASDGLAIPAWNGDGFNRYYFRWRPLPRWVHFEERPPWLQRAAHRVSWHQPAFRLKIGFGRAPDMIGWRARRAPFGAGVRLYGGPAWWMARREVTSRMIAASSGTPLAEHFRATFCPDEAFFHTLLANDPEVRLIGRNYRYVRFGPDEASPDSLTVQDLPLLRASGDYFARKFEPATGRAALDRLDEELGVTGAGIPAALRMER